MSAVYTLSPTRARQFLHTFLSRYPLVCPDIPCPDIPRYPRLSRYPDIRPDIPRYPRLSRYPDIRPDIPSNVSA